MNYNNNTFGGIIMKSWSREFCGNDFNELNILRVVLSHDYKTISQHFPRRHRSPFFKSKSGGHF